VTLRIPLSKEVEAELRERASAAGQDVESFVLKAVEDSLALNEKQATAKRFDNPAKWAAAFRAWGEDHPKRDQLADDSRETIYSGRSE
jgi:hypothetical protein